MCTLGSWHPAQLFDDLADWKAAVKDWDRVVALDSVPDRWVYRLYLAIDLARADDHERAVAEAEAVQKNPKVSDEGVFALVRAYALSIAPVRKDTQRTPAEQSRLAEDYAVRAMALLQKLHAQGFFRDADNLRELEFDLELLRFAWPC